MRLEPALYQAMQTPHMAHHAAWHAARIPARLVPVPDRASWQAARAMCPGVVDWNSQGAGAQFLQFHHEMVAMFHTMCRDILHQPAPIHAWHELPHWLRERFTPEYMDAFHCRLHHLLHCGSADELGNFLEACGPEKSLGSGIHNLCHGYIALIEAQRDPHDPLLHDAGMDDPSTSHHNEIFWRLHGWIDNLYLRWQHINGHIAQPSPTDPLTPGMPGMPDIPDMPDMPGMPATPTPPTDMGGMHMTAAHTAPPPASAGPMHVHAAAAPAPSAMSAAPEMMMVDMPACQMECKPPAEKPPAKPEKPMLTPGLQAILRARFNPM